MATTDFENSISSMTPTAASREVSLYSRMNSEVAVGITRRMVWGMMTLNMVVTAFMPRERAASNWPLWMDWMPARKISHRYAPELNASTKMATRYGFRFKPNMGRPKKAM